MKRKQIFFPNTYEIITNWGLGFANWDTVIEERLNLDFSREEMLYRKRNDCSMVYWGLH